MTTWTAADRFLVLLRDNPTLLDPVTGIGDGAEMTRRSRDEVHSCVRCGARPATALIASTLLGERWLDLCMEHYSWILADATPRLSWS